VIVIKGQEVPTTEGHLLVLGIDHNRHLKEHKSLEYTLKEARNCNGTVIIDHPFYLNGLGNHLRKNLKLFDYIDAIEIHNGEASFGLPIKNTSFSLYSNRKA